MGEGRLDFRMLEFENDWKSQSSLVLARAFDDHCALYEGLAAHSLFRQQGLELFRN